jgi:epoxyqueuosine reductase
MLGTSYAPPLDPLRLAGQGDTGVISVYAWNRDYHDLIKKRLKTLARWLVTEGGGELKVFVDTAPVMEKPLAAAAGLGWQGKHTNLVSRKHGSWLFLGAIYTTLDLTPEETHADRCGSCTRCQTACPTQAFPSPYRLDARRCLAYLTIEHKGPIPEEFRQPMANRIYGCDDCLSVCPWNRFAKATEEPAFLPRAELTAPKLVELLALDDALFRALFSGSAIKRIGVNRFIRNCLYAAGNSGEGALIPAVQAHLGSDDPVVADAARWAMARLEAA